MAGLSMIKIKVARSASLIDPGRKSYTRPSIQPRLDLSKTFTPLIKVAPQTDQ